jgi:hypothetical protein
MMNKYKYSSLDGLIDENESGLFHVQSEDMYDRDEDFSEEFGWIDGDLDLYVGRSL